MNAPASPPPLRKITVEVEERLLQAARAEGAGLSETVREALEMLARRRAFERFKSLRGKVQFSSTWQELRGKDDD